MIGITANVILHVVDVVHGTHAHFQPAKGYQMAVELLLMLNIPALELTNLSAMEEKKFA